MDAEINTEMKLTEKKIKKEIVNLKSKSLAVLPHFYFVKHLKLSKNTIEKWARNVRKSKRDLYIYVLEGNLLGTFLTEYLHEADVIQLEKVLMVTQEGTKNMLKYVLKKENRSSELNEMLEMFNNAFVRVKQSKLKQNVFEDIEYEDRQYKIDDILNKMNIMNINDSPNTTVVIGDRNKVNAQYKVNENKKSFIVPKWLRVSCWVIFAITICWLVLSVWYHYTTTDKILEFFVSFFWYDWLILMLNVISIIIALRK